jgi:hypothetical protein
LGSRASDNFYEENGRRRRRGSGQRASAFRSRWYRKLKRQWEREQKLAEEYEAERERAIDALVAAERQRQAGEAEIPEAAPAKRARHRVKRKSVKQVEKETGKSVRAVTHGADGSRRFEFGQPDASNNTDAEVDAWIKKNAH